MNLSLSVIECMRIYKLHTSSLRRIGKPNGLDLLQLSLRKKDLSSQMYIIPI